MARWDIEMCHIVDVDGQLLAIDAEIVDTTSLLMRANQPSDRELWLVRAGERFAIGSKQQFRLSRDEVLFFETSTRNRVILPSRLAA